MRKELIEEAKTVDAAIEAACDRLGCNRDDCEWEIIDLPRKGFLGLKTFPARVKVCVEVPDKEPEQREIQPRMEHRTEHFAKLQPPPQMPRQAAARIESAPPPSFEAHSAQKEPKPTYITEGFTEKDTLAMDYIRSILSELGVSSNLLLTRENTNIHINIAGEGLGAIIGRRGETLDAIQYLASLVANRLEGEYMRVMVDCGDYRSKRKETLEALAKKLSVQVLKTNVSKILEPMNPFERRVIHATVSKIEGVTSSSVGDEPNRRVVITSPTARKPTPNRSFHHEGERRDDTKSFRGSLHRPRDRGERAGLRGKDSDRRPPSRGPTTEPQGPPKETPEASAMGSAPYGKVDLS